jgi:hypothetical protein
LWVLVFGHTPKSPIPNPQSPIPNPQSPIPKIELNKIKKYKLIKYKKETSFINVFSN